MPKSKSLMCRSLRKVLPGVDFVPLQLGDDNNGDAVAVNELASSSVIDDGQPRQDCRNTKKPRTSAGGASKQIESKNNTKVAGAASTASKKRVGGRQQKHNSSQAQPGKRQALVPRERKTARGNNSASGQRTDVGRSIQVKAGGKTDLETDLSKSFAANVDERLRHWQSVEEQIRSLKDRLQDLESQYREIPENLPQNRPLLAELRTQMQELRIHIDRLQQSSDPTEYLYCVANVIREIEQQDDDKQPWESQLQQKVCQGDNDRDVPMAGSAAAESGVKFRNNKPAVDDKIRVNALGPLKQKIKKKKLPHQQHNDANTFQIKPITSYDLFSGMLTEKVDSAKKLAQYLHEIPLDTSEVEYCPNPGCENVVMNINERPPSVYCPKCGLTKEIMDNTSAAVHDKETTTHQPFTYRPKLHFISWIRRITGKLKFSIPPEVTNEVYFRLYQRGIRSLDEVTWDVVDNIIRTLAKTDNSYAEYYPHVYQITNIIRGAPILVFTDEEEQEIIEYFDPIYKLWESHKHLFNSERSNFMYNALVLQVIFRILGYPDDMIKLFNSLKGETNKAFYNDVIRLICKELGEKPFTTAELELTKFGPGRQDILSSLRQMGLTSEEGADDVNNNSTSTNESGCSLPEAGNHSTNIDGEPTNASVEESVDKPGLSEMTDGDCTLL